MRANQNSSRELGLYPKNDPTPLSSNSVKTATISKLSAFGTGLRTATKTRNGASKTTCEIDDKNQIEEQFIFS
jgi:hypothetical protein